MSTDRTRRVLLDRLVAGSTVVLPVLLDLPMVPEWADGRDAEGRSVLLVGRHALGSTDAADEAIDAVLELLAEGVVPPGCHEVAYQPKASAAIAEIVAGSAAEVLCWGSRASGKTQAVTGAMTILSELHVRDGYAAPVRALWLHASLVDASAKTGRSLEEPMWGGTWRLENDRHTAVFALGGTSLVVADFVGTQDVQAQERLRAGAHVVIAEEAVGTLDEAGGIAERSYAVALTSTLRLEGRRRVGIVGCNPGSREHWVYERFLAEGHDPRRVAVHVPSRDRLNPEQIAEQGAPFRDAPDLKARLVDETWTDLRLGPAVTVGYDPARHVATEPLWLVPGTPIWIGWDTAPGSHVHAAVIAQRNGPRIHVFATLVSANAGLKQFIDEQVLPWVVKRAPWALGRERSREFLTHVLDPAAFNVNEGGDIDQNAERRIRATLGGGTFKPGAQHWTPRLAPLLAVLSPTSDVVLKFDPGPACDVGRRALAGMWHYDLTRGGTVERDAPAKNERLFADVGDALCYLVGDMRPSRAPKSRGWKPERSKIAFNVGDYTAVGIARRTR